MEEIFIIFRLKSAALHRVNEKNDTLPTTSGRRGGLMVSALDSGANGPGSSPSRGHCVVFLGKTLYSHSASLHPGVQMGTGELNAGG